MTFKIRKKIKFTHISKIIIQSLKGKRNWIIRPEIKVKV